MAKVLLKGNEALAEAALAAGCRFYSGYPITPQTEILEYLFRQNRNLPELIWYLEQRLQVQEHLQLHPVLDFL